MRCNVLIFDFDDKKIADGIDPSLLAERDDLWEQDVNAYAPWKPVLDPAPGSMPGVRVWQSGRGSGDLSVIVCGRCGSSMDIAWRLMDQGRLNVWDSVLAVEQRAGRGRYKRNWISPAGNIYAAWYWPDPDAIGRTGGKWHGLIPLVAGYILATLLESRGVPVQIKWPNDLLVKGRKFGGILIETRSDKRLVGIGLNLSTSPDDNVLRDDFALPATHLRREGVDATPLDLWLNLVEDGKDWFERLINDLSPEGFVKLADSRIAWIGKRVRVETGRQGVYTATIAGLSEDGGLRLRSGTGEHLLYAGSVIPAESKEP